MYRLTLLLIFCFATCSQISIAQNSPKDDVFGSSGEKEPILKYDKVQEGDIIWEQRVSRIIPVNQLQNKVFKNEKSPLISLLLDPVQKGEITAFATSNFQTAFTKEEAKDLGRDIDTLICCYGCTWEEMEKVHTIVNELNPEDVRAYKIEEVWYWNEKTSQMAVRIISLAPVVDRYDDNGNWLLSLPLFWVSYDQIRPYLAQHKVFSNQNDASQSTWENVFESRQFGSHLSAKSFREVDWSSERAAGLDGRHPLFEAERIENSIMNFEQSSWSY